MDQIHRRFSTDHVRNLLRDNGESLIRYSAKLDRPFPIEYNAISKFASWTVMHLFQYPLLGHEGHRH
jgi:hypothetical protein